MPASVPVSSSDAWKLHKLGDEVVKALVAADLTVHARRVRLPDGPQRQREVDAAQHHRRAGPAHQGHRRHQRHDTATLTESQFAALRHDTVGFIFQSYNLIPFLSAVENVELPLMFEPYDRKALRKRALELLELVGLGHRVAPPPTKMSGGEQQRTAIARSLISNPT